MDTNQLTAALTQLGVTPPEPLRACFYLDKLTTTQTFLSTALAQPVAAGGLGNDYPFVQQAVTATSLLNELAASLDEYLGPAVNNAMAAFFRTTPSTYQNYLTQQILNSSTNDNSISQFLVTYQITAQALLRITNNFQQNILLACQRIIADRAILQQFFNDQYPALTILGLTQIKSTGSDFHKGGKQVLILTFSIKYYIQNIVPIWSELKVIYKPSDLEADCLLAGDSAAVNRVIPNFMQCPSLVEIFNNRVRAMLPTNPDLEELPTYRFLPRNYLSLPVGSLTGLLRNAYGYIEYLGYELYGESFSKWDLFPLGSSDYLIFYLQNEQQIISQFYRQLGQLLALSGIFSITDMHIENVRVKSYQPFLIDLEVSLVEPITDLMRTAAFGNMGGINDTGGITGSHLNDQDFHWALRVLRTSGLQCLIEDYKDKYYQNRLWIVRSSRSVVPVSPFWLLEGFTNGMAVLQAAEQQSDFQAWFTRLNNVVVRYLPYDTTKFKAVRRIIYLDTPDSANSNALPGPTIQGAMLQQITNYYNAYAAAPTPEPNLLVWQNAQVQTDYDNLDIPVFYHRIGSLDILDSMGTPLLVQNPTIITVLNNATPPAPVAQAVATGRTTYFANVPTTTIVQQGQLQALTGAGFTAQVQTFVGQIMTYLNVVAPPNPSVLVPRW